MAPRLRRVNAERRRQSILLVFGAADFRPASLSSMIRSEHKLRLRILMEFALGKLTTNVFDGKRVSKQIDPP